MPNLSFVTGIAEDTIIWHEQVDGSDHDTYLAELLQVIRQNKLPDWRKLVPTCVSLQRTNTPFLLGSEHTVDFKARRQKQPALHYYDPSKALILQSDVNLKVLVLSCCMMDI